MVEWICLCLCSLSFNSHNAACAWASSSIAWKAASASLFCASTLSASAALAAATAAALAAIPSSNSTRLLSVKNPEIAAAVSSHRALADWEEWAREARALSASRWASRDLSCAEAAVDRAIVRGRSYHSHSRRDSDRRNLEWLKIAPKTPKRAPVVSEGPEAFLRLSRDSKSASFFFFFLEFAEMNFFFHSVLLLFSVASAQQTTKTPLLLSALTTLYREGGGLGWRGAGATWGASIASSSEPCTWAGVVCDDAQLAVRSLDLTGFGITLLPPSIFPALATMKELVLDMNRLTALPVEMAEHLGANLTALSVNSNALSALPRWPAPFRSLAWLAVRANSITEFPEESPGYYPVLETLILGGNRLASLPASISRWAGTLKYMYVDSNRLVALPETIGALGRLANLFAMDNAIASLPESFCQLRGLAELDLDHNPIGALPECFGMLGSLRDLWVQNCRLGALPESFGMLSSLVSLTIFDNELRGLPASFGDLPRLAGLDIRRNRLASFPDPLFRLTRLSLLYMSDNPDVGAGSPGALNLTALTSLSALLMTRTGLRRAPLLSSSSLTRLDLAGNAISGGLSLCAPAIRDILIFDNPALSGLSCACAGGAGTSRCFFPYLRSLNAGGCNITSPAFLAGSPDLENLDLSRNPVGDAVFGMVSGWPNLAALRLEAVGATVPFVGALSSVRNLTKLISLDLAGNSGLGGAFTLQATVEARLWVGNTMLPFPLYILRLDGTNITAWEQGTERFFFNLRVLSLRNVPLLDAGAAFPSDWSYLETLDVRGTSRLAAPLSGAARFPGAPDAIDAGSNSSCPSEILGGTITTYAVTADPWLYNYTLCSCLDGFFGVPSGSGGCQACPAAAVGASVACAGSVASVDGGWFVRRAGLWRVAVCPSEPGARENPCKLARLNVTRGDGPAVAEVQCREGHQGRLCARCAPGFYKSGRLCRRCSDSSPWLLPVVSILAITVLGVKAVGQAAERSGMLRTLVAHAQLVTLMPVTLSGTLTKSFAEAPGGLHLDGLECSAASTGWDGFWAPFVMALLLPAIVLVGSAWVAAAHWGFNRILVFFVSGRARRGPPADAYGEGQDPAFRSRVMVAAAYLWLVLLYGALTRLLAPLNCTGLGSSSGSRFVSSALWIRCDRASRRYAGAKAAAAILGLGVYGGGTVLLMAWALLRRSPREEDAVVTFLRAPYAPGCMWWEVVMLSRKVLIVMADVLTPLNSVGRPVLISLILAASLTANAWKKPFLKRSDTVAETLSLLTLLSSFLSGLVIINPIFNDDQKRAIGIAVIAGNLAFVVALALVVLFAKVRTADTRKWIDTQELRSGLLQEAE